jgi:thiamine biosynthesis lipoprotein ApbE
MDGEQAEPNVSQEMLDLFKMSEELWTTTEGAFDPRIGHAIALWKKAEKEQVLPTPDALKSAVAAIKEQAWRIDAGNKSIRRVNKTPLTFDGLAKGLIVDKACAAAMSVAGVEGALVNIGGDLKLAGTMQDEVTISDPKSPAKPLVTVDLSGLAIATSGNYERGSKVGNESFSHILDPRSAMPAQQVISSSVIAENAALADALATAFSVLPVEKSLAICKNEPQLACLLVTRDGTVVTSPGWPDNINPQTGKPVPKDRDHSPESQLWNANAELKIDFEINRVEGRGYRRPYVAVWIEDSKQRSVRTLVLWLQTSNPGPRWHRDLKRWYKQNGTKKLASGSNLIGTISAATKPAGSYKTLWDGKDDNGQMVKKGKYTVYMEAAREHGTYQILSKEIVIGDEALSVDIGTNVEIKSAQMEYLPKGSSK